MKKYILFLDIIRDFKQARFIVLMFFVLTLSVTGSPILAEPASDDPAGPDPVGAGAKSKPDLAFKQKGLYIKGSSGSETFVSCGGKLAIEAHKRYKISEQGGLVFRIRYKVRNALVSDIVSYKTAYAVRNKIRTKGIYDNELGTMPLSVFDTISRIDGGNSVSRSIMFPMVPSRAFVTIELDENNHTAESNESNNTCTIEFTPLNAKPAVNIMAFKNISSASECLTNPYVYKFQITLKNHGNAPFYNDVLSWISIADEHHKTDSSFDFWGKVVDASTIKLTRAGAKQILKVKISALSQNPEHMTAVTPHLFRITTRPYYSSMDLGRPYLFPAPKKCLHADPSKVRPVIQPPMTTGGVSGKQLPSKTKVQIPIKK
jgi:hypothetical protein